MGFGWLVFVFLTYEALLNKSVYASGPFRPIIGGNNALQCWLNVGVADQR